MSVKEGTFTLSLWNGKATAVKGYIYWYTDLINGNTYDMNIFMYGYADCTDVYGGRTCWYQFWVNDALYVNDTVTFNSTGWQEVYSTSFQVEANDDGKWDGWFGGAFGFTSDTYGPYSVGGDATGLVVGSANYKVYYYTGYGSNALYTTQSGFDKGDTCNVIDSSPARNNDVSTSNFTITGNKNGGDADSSATAAKIDTTKYTFKGWSKTNGATSATYTSTSTFSVTGNIALYGVWSSTTSTTYSNNTIAALEPATPTRASIGNFYNITIIPNNGQASTQIEAGVVTSYTFKGWASSSSSTTALASNTAYTEGTTVYAIWESSTEDKSTVDLPIPARDVQILSTYTVTLDANGGTVSPTSQTSSKTKSYIFDGWSTVNGNNSYIVSNSYTPTNKSDHSLYAIWTEVESTDPISLPIPTYTSFKFLGWGINVNSTSYVPMPYTPTQDVTLYAIYKPSYTGEPYIWHDGSWHRVIPHLRYEDVFNSCINAV